jgi:predicted HTH transcriptional regulator
MLDTDAFGSRVAALLGEVPGVEFKRGGPLTDNQLVAKVTCAVLAMANRRDGGLVVIGVEDEDNQLGWIGMSADDAATWIPDHLADKVAPYADPSVSLELSKVEWEGRTYAVIEVAEFDAVPVVCKKDGIRLRQGAIYVRPRRKPESVEIPTAADARDLLDLAAEKLTRSFLATANRVGLVSSSAAPQPDNELFNEQAREYLE